MSAATKLDVLAVMDVAAPHYPPLREARAAVAELIDEVRADLAMPNTVTISRRDDWKPGDPEGGEWWAWRRAQLEAAGYSMACEYDDGSELFYRDSTSPRLRAALARVQGGAE